MSLTNRSTPFSVHHTRQTPSERSLGGETAGCLDN